MILAVLTTGDGVGGHAAAARARNRERLLSQILAQQWRGPKVLVVDGHLANPREGFERLEVDKGSRRDNGFVVRQLLGLVSEHFPMTPVLVLEDDVELADGALPVIETFPIPSDVHAICWFENIFRPTARAGLYRVRGGTWSGCGQAVTLTAAAVDELLGSRDWNPSIGWDTNLAVALRDATIAYVLPALVQHREGPSIAHPNGTFPYSETFKGKAVGWL